MNPDPEDPAILVGIFTDVVWIRVREKGCFSNSPEVRAFAEQMIAEGNHSLVVDLEDCPCMDSTFMGTLTGIALKLRQSPDGNLKIINLGTRNLESLRELGLDHVMDLDVDGVAWSDERELVKENVSQAVPPAGRDSATRQEVMADAHVALCEANAENVPKFRDVLDFLGHTPPG